MHRTPSPERKGEQSERQEGSRAGALPYRGRGGCVRTQIEEEEKQETASRIQGEGESTQRKGSVVRQRKTRPT